MRAWVSRYPRDKRLLERANNWRIEIAHGLTGFNLAQNGRALFARVEYENKLPILISFE